MGTEDQRNSETRGTVGTEDQWVQRTRGSLGVKEWENSGEHGKKDGKEAPIIKLRWLIYLVIYHVVV